jgi:hypothetical protein
MTISTFNMIFTALPICAYAALEADVAPATALRHPAVYGDSRGVTRPQFFARWLAVVYGLGTWHAFPAYFAAWYTLGSSGGGGCSAQGDAYGLVATGTAVFVALVAIVGLRLAVLTHHWSWITHLVYWLSIGLVFPFLAAISHLWTSAPPGAGPSAGGVHIPGVADMTGVAGQLFSSPAFWLACLVLAPAAALLPDLAAIAARRQARPTLAQLLQEQEALERARKRWGRGRRGRQGRDVGGSLFGRLVRRRAGCCGGGEEEHLPVSDGGRAAAVAGFASGAGLELAAAGNKKGGGGSGSSRRRV